MLFLLLVGLLPLVLSASSAVREFYAFEHETKWACFYRSSTAIEGLNPAIWRLDQYKNLIMAGLNYNCSDCLCYTFDHRSPIGDVNHIDNPSQVLIKYMTSIDNCQVLSYRVNLLKGSNEDIGHSELLSQFGCDDRTMNILVAKNFRALCELEKYLLTADRKAEIEKHYRDYVNGPYFLNESGKC